MVLLLRRLYLKLNMACLPALDTSPQLRGCLDPKIGMQKARILHAFWAEKHCSELKSTVALFVCLW